MKPCVYLPYKDFPVKIEKRTGGNVDSHLEALAQGGLLYKYEDMGIPSNAEQFKGLIRYDEPVPITIYNLSDLGDKTIETSKFQKRSRFCYGRYDLIEITNVSDEYEFSGDLIRRASIRIKVIDIKDWARSASVRSQFKLERSLVSEEKPINQEVTFAYTEKGWVVKRFH